MLTSSASAPLSVSKLLCFLGFSWAMISLSACTTAPTEVPCIASSDCGEGELCVEGACQALTMTMEMGPTGECLTNTDCGEGRRCVENTCYDNECVDGESRACDTQCGTGTQLCSGGIWRACSAQPMNEVCGTGEDEDCDGQIDEGCSGCDDGETRACSTTCGAGQERCLNGSFVGCDAPRPRLEVCGDPEAPVDEDCDGTLDEGCADCDDGETRSCNQGCGVGQETCQANTWRDCTAPTPKDELCDGEDNDCDGDVDEEIMRDCSTSCGPGSERCEAGAWVGCNAPLECTCMDNLTDQQTCGQCGVRSRDCVMGVWQAWSMCMESGACVPGEDENTSCGQCGVKRRVCDAICEWGEWTMCVDEGVCAPGDVQEEACSESCGGVRRRACTNECEWGAWGACEGGIPNACSPGEEEREPCERCGERVRSCTNECAWSEWSTCQGQGACEPNEVGSEACGTSACAARERTCNNSCEWEAWGMCIEGGVCTPGQEESRECGRCGTSTRVCESSCGWSDWSVCDEPPNACNPGDTQSEVCGDTDVGVCQRGTRSRSCNNSCGWGGWGSCIGLVAPTTEICGSGLDENCDGRSETRPDRYEGTNGNNTCGSCYSLSLTNGQRTISATIDNVNDDWDYYCFQVNDGVSALPSTASVTLTNIPSGADYDLYLYKEQAGCTSNSELERSILGSNNNELIEWTESYLSDDSGLFIIGVKQLGNRSYDCDQSYTLTIDFDI